MFNGDSKGKMSQRVFSIRTWTYLSPVSMLRSTVLTGATTINGIPCRAASTAALYVPIWKLVNPVTYTGCGENKTTLFAVSPFLAILSAPTAVDTCQKRKSERRNGLPTAWISWCWNRDPTIVSQIITDGMLRIWSSSDVSLKTC